MELPDWLDRGWDELASTIPVDLEATAQACGALQRRRSIRSAADLLRLVLIYAFTLSLRTHRLVGRLPAAGGCEPSGCGQAGACDLQILGPLASGSPPSPGFYPRGTSSECKATGHSGRFGPFPAP
jgi:hypothetical protein